MTTGLGVAAGAGSLLLHDAKKIADAMARVDTNFIVFILFVLKLPSNGRL